MLYSGSRRTAHWRISSPRLLLKSKKSWTDACKAKIKQGWMRLGIITWLGLWACKMIGSKPCDVIGYPMVLSCLLGTTRCVPQEQFPRKPYNKSTLVSNMAGYWPRCFFAVYGPRRKKARPITSHLYLRLVNNLYISRRIIKRRSQHLNNF